MRIFVTTTNLATGARLRLHITTNEGVFASDFENVDDVNLPIQLDRSYGVFDPRPRGLETLLRT